MSLEAQQIAETAVGMDPIAVLKWITALALSIVGCSKALSIIAKDRSQATDANLATVGKHAQIDIIELLQRRMTDLEDEQRELRSELEAERDRRTEAEDMVDALTRRVAALEAQIRALGHEPVGGK